MTIQKHFRTFHNAIKLSKQDDAYSKAREQDNSITNSVKEAFRNKGYAVIETFITGSFSTDTTILNKTDDFDIDRALVIADDEAPENPITPKIECDNILVKRGFKNSIIKKPCVTADYASENLHIDYTIYKKSGDSYKLAVGKRNSDENNRLWDNSNPKGLKDWIKNKSSYFGSADDKLQQFNRLVRYLKRWRDEQFSEEVAKKVFSIGITVMVKESFAASFNDDGAPEDLKALNSTVSQMLSRGYFFALENEQYRVSVYLPVIPGRDVFGGSSVNTGTQFRNKLKRLDGKLQDSMDETDEIKQCKILRTMFGDDFPVPEKSSTSSNSKKATFSNSGKVGTSQGA